MAQHFDLNSVLKDQDASIMLEDGTLLPFAFGSPLPIIPNASTHDADHDGQIGFALHLAPDATLHNETDLGFHVGADLKVLDFGDPFGALFSLGGDLPLGEIPLYDTTFGLAGSTRTTSSRSRTTTSRFRRAAPAATHCGRGRRPRREGVT